VNPSASGRRPAMGRLIMVTALGGAVGIAAGFASPWQVAVLLGWNAAALAYLLWIWLTIWPMDARSTREHASEEDPSRALAGSLVVGAAIASLVAVSVILIKAANSDGGSKAYFLAVAALSVVLAWWTVHTTFTLRYAHRFFSTSAGGVQFHQRVAEARYSDFAYLAFTIGMTFQVSDTDLTTQAMRRIALQHALISYVFGAVILAMVINVVASLLH
jgi:uncharacterized membrane protein